MHFFSHVNVALLPNNKFVASHVRTQKRFVGSAKYFKLFIIGHFLTQSLESSKSENVPCSTGHKSTHKLVDGSPTQPFGQSAGAKHTFKYPYVVELHLFTHLLKLSFCANHPSGH
jgi:hypothetical protein